MMLRFFRNIRQKLIEQKKMRKYVWYALGEIFLVMIGILLALQVNNWNEYRNDRVVEKKILEEVLLDMRINRRDLENSIQRTETHLQKIVELNNHLLSRESLYDSLALDLREASSTEQFTPRLTGFESLNDRGVDIIRNENLRNYIITTYGLRYQQLVMEGREHEQFDNPTKDLLPYLKRHLVVDTNKTSTYEDDDIGYSFTNYGLGIKDYDALLDDQEFFLILQKSMFNRAQKISMAKRLVELMETVEEMIEQELMKI